MCALRDNANMRQLDTEPAAIYLWEYSMLQKFELISNVATRQ